ncbi:ABC transporter substrate-binding protein [Verminephrobacter aporrectodeae subsp. tuberculatae]|uniref:ABC transporter substrate-binding protein n=1 Tax=Verminephrobacter aporrectodeae TaxID=1110389 RepID=UPI00224397F2|nr:ABC transporter substrate-binding protein [Verminephrobacter aporrectodeae]MCW8165887.1 ABC transporter substrate-binding protein [Verminephrobacter aporrectodeae subsp. tuberculatae]MCW8170089.1 ABC transporter substrate-binding protein [Verminephrobacter aporrectodeae subsp. tuberculatae]MCW8197397.1 ABC transporter substrate-binding protein [Verminephrobacter aporrectodeae subsp. tuberculatae]
MISRKSLLGVAAFCAAWLISPQGVVAQQRGGVLSVATVGEPPTLDPMASTADLVGIVTQHMFETLYTFDKTWHVTPLLAESLPEVSADGKAYSIKLRQGVKFHSGETMTSADVVASLKRWSDVASRGKQAAARIDKIEAAGANTVRISLKAPYAPLLALLAFNNSAAVVMPAGKQAVPLGDPIGTGPYRLKERKADQYIQLVRFDGYQSRTGDADGYGGARKQYLDEIRFVPLPDPNTRIEAAVAGQHGFVDALPVEAYDRLKNQKASEPVLVKPFGYPVFVLNTRQGSTSSADVRRAIRTALNMEDLLAAAFGSKEFYALDGAIYPKGHAWHTMAGVEGAYNIGDPEKAKALLKKAGYDGKPIRILTSRQYEFHYKMAQVASEYLKLAGFAIDLQVVDWATLTQRRSNPALWDIYITHSPFLPEPALIGALSENAPGWWATPARKSTVDAFVGEIDHQKRGALWAEVQKTIYAETPFIKIGDFNSLAAQSRKLGGVAAAPWPYFWNAYLKN